MSELGWKLTHESVEVRLLRHDGCQRTTDLGERAGLSYTEEWIHEDELKRQLRSDRFSRLAELMERATERPKIEFALPSGMRGLDYAEAVREGGKS